MGDAYVKIRNASEIYSRNIVIPLITSTLFVFLFPRFEPTDVGVQSVLTSLPHYYHYCLLKQEQYRLVHKDKGVKRSPDKHDKKTAKDDIDLTRVIILL